MRQVPYPLIVGNGNMATHFCHYLSLLEIDYCQWSRKSHYPISLEALFEQSTITILLISDDSLTLFIESHPFLKTKPIIHFSGALSIEGTQSAHPLMSFHHELYDLDTYKSIAFILELGQKNSLAFLPNAFFTIPQELKMYYHMLCVLSGNFTCILWQKFFHEMESRFNLPKAMSEPYFKQIMQNIIQAPNTALTGPLVRNDINTINSHLLALKNDEFSLIYQAFVTLFENRRRYEST